MKIEFRCIDCRQVKSAYVSDEEVEGRPRVKAKHPCGECGAKRVWEETISSMRERGWRLIDIE